jgi:hypothetical protein
MRDVMRNDASGPCRVNRKFSAGFHAPGSPGPEMRAKKYISAVIAFSRAVLSF